MAAGQQEALGADSQPCNSFDMMNSFDTRMSLPTAPSWFSTGDTTRAPSYAIDPLLVQSGLWLSPQRPRTLLSPPQSPPPSGALQSPPQPGFAVTPAASDAPVAGIIGCQGLPSPIQAGLVPTPSQDGPPQPPPLLVGVQSPQSPPRPISPMPRPISPMDRMATVLWRPATVTAITPGAGMAIKPGAGTAINPGATLQERVENVENLLSSSSDKHSRALDALEQQYNNLLTVYKGLATEVAAFGATYTSMGARAQDWDARLKDLEAAQQAHEAFRADHEDKVVSLHETQSGALEALNAQKVAYDKTSKDVEAIQQNYERISRLERIVTEIENRPPAKINLMNERLSACEKQSEAMYELRLANTRLSSDVTEATEKCAKLSERLTSLEQALGDSDKQARELDTLKDAHAKQADGFRASNEKHKAVDVWLEDFERRLANLVDENTKQVVGLELHKADSDARWATFLERLDSFERHVGQLNSSQSELRSKAAEISDLRGRLSELAEPLSAVADLSQGHTVLRERFDYLEKMSSTQASVCTRRLDEIEAAVNAEKDAQVEVHINGRLAGFATSEASSISPSNLKSAPEGGRLDSMEQAMVALKRRLDRADQTPSEGSPAARFDHMERSMAALEKKLVRSVDGIGRELQTLRMASSPTQRASRGDEEKSHN